jgi:hypothetical protein
MEKLLAIASLGQRAYGRWLFQRLISGVLVIAGLTIILSMMVSAVLVGGLLTIYYILLYYGIGQLMAVTTTAVLALLLIAALVFLVLTSLQHLRKLPRTLLRKSPLTSRAMDTLDAFTDGLMTG